MIGGTESSPRSRVRAAINSCPKSCSTRRSLDTRWLSKLGSRARRTNWEKSSSSTTGSSITVILIGFMCPKTPICLPSATGSPCSSGRPNQNTNRVGDLPWSWSMDLSRDQGTYRSRNSGMNRAGIRSRNQVLARTGIKGRAKARIKARSEVGMIKIKSGRAKADIKPDLDRDFQNMGQMTGQQSSDGAIRSTNLENQPLPATWLLKRIRTPSRCTI